MENNSERSVPQGTGNESRERDIRYNIPEYIRSNSDLGHSRYAQMKRQRSPNNEETLTNGNHEPGEDNVYDGNRLNSPNAGHDSLQNKRINVSDSEDSQKHSG